jgi:hypothetical protein
MKGEGGGMGRAAARQRKVRAEGQGERRHAAIGGGLRGNGRGQEAVAVH